ISYTKMSKPIFEDSSGRFRLVGPKNNTPETTKFLSLTRIAFWNSGSVPISASDVRRPFEISLSSGSRIIEWSLQRSYPEIAGFSLTGDNKSIQLQWKYFDPGFGGVIDLYQTGVAKDAIISMSYIGDQRIVNEMPNGGPWYVYIPAWLVVSILAFLM